MIAVTDGSLIIEQKSLWQQRVQQIEVAQLHRIVVGPSGMEVNDEPIMELQLQMLGGEKTGLLSERSEEELQFLATSLNQLTHLDSNPRPHWAQWAADSTDWRTCHGEVVEGVFVTRANDLFQIDIGSVGLRRFWGGIPMGLVFASIGLGIGGFAVAGPFGGWANAAFPFLFAVTFSLVGVAIIVATCIAADRSFTIKRIDNSLIIDRSGRWSAKTWTYPIDTISSIDLSDSGWKENGQAKSQLQIKVSHGDKLSILTGRDEKQIAAVAALLNENLK